VRGLEKHFYRPSGSMPRHGETRMGKDPRLQKLRGMGDPFRNQLEMVRGRPPENEKPEDSSS